MFKELIAVIDINTPVLIDARSEVGKVGLPPLSACLKLGLAIAAGQPSFSTPSLPSFLDALMSPPLLSVCDSFFILLGEGSSLRKLEVRKGGLPPLPR